MIIKCLTCNKEFKIISARENTAKYCCTECYYKGKTNYIEYKVCPVCQKEFKVTQWDKDKNCCSRECLTVLRNSTKETYKCAYCGAQLKNKTNMYCSKACYGLSRKKIRCVKIVVRNIKIL